MTRRQCRGWVGRFAAAAVVAYAAGCATPCDPRVADAAASLSDAERDRVAVYVINSPLDPLRVTKLGRLKRRLTRSGFAAEMLDSPKGEKLARLVRAEHDAGRRVAVVAWSGASLAVHDALTELAPEGGHIGLVVYVDSDWLKGRLAEAGHPGNAGKVVLIYRARKTPPEIDGATVYRVDAWGHLRLPRREEVATAVVAELTALARDRLAAR